MKNNLGMCMNCMAPLQEGEGTCASCGESVNLQNSPNFLPVGYTYHNRFLFGRVLKSTGENVCYTGFDLMQNCRVVLEEFAPMSLCTRNLSTQELNPKYGSEVKYKALRSDFKELSIELMETDLEGTIPIFSVFEANNTVYTVYKYINVVTFAKYLQHGTGDISWAETKRLILPLINTVSALHERGIIHRGISPETILIDEHKNLYLSGFMSASARSAGGEIPCELYEGYSAPEQYEQGAWQNKGTDVYSICAVIYRAVTGARPVDYYALHRGERQIPAIEMTFRIPETVSKTLEMGMEIDIKKRISCATQLIRQLLQEEQSDTAVFTRQIPILTKDEIETFEKVKAVVEPDEQDKTMAINLNEPPKKGTVKRIFLSAVATILAFLIFGGIALYYYNQKLEEEKDKYLVSAVPQTLLLQNFVGEKYNILAADDKLTSWYTFKVTEVYSDTVSKGTVISQYPPKGTTMMQGRTVLLTVSKGSNKIEMPDLLDMDIMEAVRVVALLGCETEFSFVDDEEAPLDVVLETSPEAGTKFIPQNSKITLYISADSDFRKEVMEVENSAEGEPKEDEN